MIIKSIQIFLWIIVGMIGVRVAPEITHAGVRALFYFFGALSFMIAGGMIAQNAK